MRRRASPLMNYIAWAIGVVTGGLSVHVAFGPVLSFVTGLVSMFVVLILTEVFD